MEFLSLELLEQENVKVYSFSSFAHQSVFAIQNFAFQNNFV